MIYVERPLSLSFTMFLVRCPVTSRSEDSGVFIYQLGRSDPNFWTSARKKGHRVGVRVRIFVCHGFELINSSKRRGLTGINYVWWWLVEPHQRC